MKVRFRPYLTITSACVLLAGCLNNRYVAPVTSFQSSTAQTISAISDFYSSRNSYELQLYFSGIAADPKLEVGIIDPNGKPTPLGRPTFSPASIKARLDALSLVSVYASRLNDLANTSAPSDFETAAGTLGNNLSSLDKTFQNLGATDPTAGSYIGPIASLIGTIGKMYLNDKRDKLIKDAIERGGPAVNTVLSQIKDDMDHIFSKEVITGEGDKLATLVNRYNSDRNKLSYDQRMARLDEIRSVANSASSATASAPSQLVSSMLDANNALIKSATATKTDKQLSLASLNNALSAWIAEIQTLTSEIKPLVK